MHILVTGGAGFIGTALCKYLLKSTSHSIVNIDKLTYAADRITLDTLTQNDRYKFHKADICDGVNLASLIDEEQPDAIMHLAAESHVDRSIAGAAEFINTNLVGTYNLLEAARHYYEGKGRPDSFRFLHVSTDEVYGSLGDDDPAFTETTPYDPHSPYSASKAGSDHLVRAWHDTYGLPVLITNCSNNYGPHQYPEKFIPVIIRQALAGKEVPVYGQGTNIRDWLYVEDHADALVTVLENGKPGESYNIGGNTELKNIDLAISLCRMLDELRPDSPHAPHENLIKFVVDRPGHDYRYAMDINKIERELGWSPATTWEDGIRQTVDWYLQNPIFLNQKDADNPSLKKKGHGT